MEILDPEGDLEAVGTGALIDFECEIYVPDAIRMLSDSAGALRQMSQMLPAASSMGLDIEGMPDSATLAAVTSLVDSFGAELVLVGERDDSDWRVAGRLSSKWLRGDVDGYARVIGKVSSKIRVGATKPLIALPGAALIPREQRRKMEREGPKPGEEDSWLRGPALMLDILAVYR